MSTADDPSEIRLHQIAKAIQDLDEIVVALLTSPSSSKPWQRLLRQLLHEVDRRMQVLRLTISMERDDSEISAAVRDLLAALRQARSFGARSRADQATNAVLLIAQELGQSIDKWRHHATDG